MALALSQLSIPVRVSAILLLGLLAARAVRTHGWRAGGRAVVRIARRGDGRWVVTRRDGVTLVGRLHGDTFIHRSLAILTIRDGWRVSAVPVTRDALAAEAHRRLRVWLRWGPDPQDG